MLGFGHDQKAYTVFDKVMLCRLAGQLICYTESVSSFN